MNSLVKILFYTLLSVCSLGVMWLASSQFEQSAITALSDSSKANSVGLSEPLLNAVLKRQSDTQSQQASTFVVGTSHVALGFDGCKNKSLRMYVKPSVDGQNHIGIAKALMMAAQMQQLKAANVVLEVSLIEDKKSVTGEGIIYQSLLAENPLMLFLKLVGEGLRTPQGQCHSQQRRIDDNTLLEKSRQLSRTLQPQRLAALTQTYMSYVDELLAVCANTPAVRLTLVSLPIHPELYAEPAVQQTFKYIEQHVAQHLAKTSASQQCHIAYLNLTPLGAEFSENRYWIDPGHFTPEVGKRVLTEIQQAHSRVEPTSDL